MSADDLLDRAARLIHARLLMAGWMSEAEYDAAHEDDRWFCGRLAAEAFAVVADEAEQRAAAFYGLEMQRGDSARSVLLSFAADLRVVHPTPAKDTE